MLGKVKIIDAGTLLLIVVLAGIVIYGIVLQIDSISGVSPSTHKRTKIETTVDAEDVFLTSLRNGPATCHISRPYFQRFRRRRA